MALSVEVEGNELAMRNSNGDIAIIPAYLTEHVQNLIAAGKHAEVDAVVNNLQLLSTKDSKFTEPNISKAI